MEKLWTPGQEEGTVEVTHAPRRVKPTEQKFDGGTYFDDELDTEASREAKLQVEYLKMVDHLRKRPDHTVYVGSAEERGKMRQVFNHMFTTKVIDYHPNIRIEYGVPDGQIRIAE